MLILCNLVELGTSDLCTFLYMYLIKKKFHMALVKKKEKQILTEVWRDGRAIGQVCSFHRGFVSQSFFLPQNHGLF